MAKQVNGHAVFKPSVVDRADVVGGVKNKIDEMGPLKYLCQPPGISHFNGKIFLSENRCDVWRVLCFTEDIQIFCVPIDPSIMPHGEGTAYQKRKIILQKEINNSFVKRSSNVLLHLFFEVHIKYCRNDGVVKGVRYTGTNCAFGLGVC